MSVTTLILLVAIAAVAAGVYFLWPSASVLNVLRSVRQKKEQRAFNGLAISELTERAQAGDSAAQYRLGYMYATGNGVTTDYPKANYWFRRAIDGGIVDAFYCLALQYERGRGTPVDYGRAIELYEKAAEAGSSEAQCNLGMLYLHGKGVATDTTRAAWWFVLATAQGNEQASINLEWLVRNRRLLDVDELTHVRDIESRAERDDANALLVLGWMFAAGFARPRDPAAARRLYERAQARGQIFAHELLSQLVARTNVDNHA